MISPNSGCRRGERFATSLLSVRFAASLLRQLRLDTDPLLPFLPDVRRRFTISELRKSNSPTAIKTTGPTVRFARQSYLDALLISSLLSFLFLVDFPVVLTFLGANMTVILIFTSDFFLNWFVPFARESKPLATVD